ncbi:hypothetical protein [Sphingomonas sp.]|uniref:hypothetical protein n=1 Tax=Sphingomonas sp. TaxID=28214 RepID=UPI00286CF51A|nr:hypothetical protein [Sphingomonas sp.]
MISPTPLPTDPIEDVDYALRRAEEESIAAVRATDPRVEKSHAGLAALYTDRSLRLIGETDERGPGQGK